MSRYYESTLSGERLRRCYDLAPPRVQQYLQAEIAFVQRYLERSTLALELGCGYGRVLGGLLERAQRVVGIDTSSASLRLARELLPDRRRCLLFQMDALDLRFRDERFDIVCCVQNGVSAFGVDPQALLAEAMRVTRRRGSVLLSSYAERFWPDRLDWFRRQADEGLLGPIDEDATGDGAIVCEDGFRATTMSPDGFRALAAACGVACRLIEVDESSVFCEIVVG